MSSAQRRTGLLDSAATKKLPLAINLCDPAGFSPPPPWENGELPWMMMRWNRAPTAHHPCPAHFTSGGTGFWDQLPWNVLVDFEGPDHGQTGATASVALGDLDLVDSPTGQMSNCWDPGALQPENLHGIWRECRCLT